VAQCPMGGETCLVSLAPSSPLRVSARLNVYIRACEGGKGPRSRTLARQSDPSRTRQGSSLHPLHSCIDAFLNHASLVAESPGPQPGRPSKCSSGDRRRDGDLLANAFEAPASTEWRSCDSQRRTRGREGGASCRSQDHKFFHPGENRVSKGIAVLPGLAPGERTQARLRPWAFRNRY